MVMLVDANPLRARQSKEINSRVFLYRSLKKPLCILYIYICINKRVVHVIYDRTVMIRIHTRTTHIYKKIPVLITRRWCVCVYRENEHILQVAFMEIRISVGPQPWNSAINQTVRMDCARSMTFYTCATEKKIDAILSPPPSPRHSWCLFSYMGNVRHRFNNVIINMMTSTRNELMIFFKGLVRLRLTQYPLLSLPYWDAKTVVKSGLKLLFAVLDLIKIQSSSEKTSSEILILLSCMPAYYFRKHSKKEEANGRAQWLWPK